ncbi:hypothetical protein FA13DRAFT_595408 [Coprinellus micaceus]|uniref:Uncharacterized protein n=1 Tax=Coprinellus micaceus TaxID=71717 RepID=A0A4Y7T6N1_COPMI|nr:hypothetical protein FA13DRAFT_595408 [Coprinellus micaceus]
MGGKVLRRPSINVLRRPTERNLKAKLSRVESMSASSSTAGVTVGYHAESPRSAFDISVEPSQETGPSRADVRLSTQQAGLDLQTKRGEVSLVILGLQARLRSTSLARGASPTIAEPGSR